MSLVGPAIRWKGPLTRAGPFHFADVRGRCRAIPGAWSSVSLQVRRDSV